MIKIACRLIFFCLIAASISKPAAFAQNIDHAWHSQFLPHGFCLQWDAPLIWTMILANVGIALAYFAIPAALWYFVRRRHDIPYPWVFRLFGMFIIACGITHLMKIVTLYKPLYWLEAAADAYTAIISLITAAALWPLIPKTLLLRSPQALEEANQKLEEAIAKSNEFTTELKAQAELLDLTHDAIMVRDLNGIIKYWNSGAEEVYGYKAHEAIGKFFFQLLKTESPIPIERIIEELIATGRWSGELINERADGKKIFVSSRQALKRDNEGNPAAVLAINSDITEHKEADERRQALAEMERSNTELEQFASIASHDLQEPLRAVAGCLTVLQKMHKDKLDGNAAELMHHAVEGAVRMRNLIKDLLTLSRIGRDGLAFQSTDLNLSLADALKNLSVHIEENNAQITYDVLPTVWADNMQMTQLFQNLINNGIKFCDARFPEIHIRAKQKGNEWIISVQDNGIGFQQEYAERIFQPFKRLHGHEEYPGTGIGLAICKRIIERHAGKIWVESEIGKGTIFYFTVKEKRG